MPSRIEIDAPLAGFMLAGTVHWLRSGSENEGMTSIHRQRSRRLAVGDYFCFAAQTVAAMMREAPMASDVWNGSPKIITPPMVTPTGTSV